MIGNEHHGAIAPRCGAANDPALEPEGCANPPPVNQRQAALGLAWQSQKQRLHRHQGERPEHDQECPADRA